MHVPLLRKRAEVAIRKLTDAEVIESGRGAAPFALLVTFTLILYARPGDMYAPLARVSLAHYTAIAAIGTYFLTLIFGRPWFHRSRELASMALLTAIFIAGVPFAFWRARSFEVLTEDWLKTAVIFFLLTQTSTTIPRIRKLVWTIILCMFVVSIFNILNPNKSLTFQGRLMGATVGFLSGNYLGVAAGSMLPFIVMFLMKTRSAIARLILLVTVPLLFWQVILSASRSSFMQMALAMILIWLLLLRRMKGGNLVAGFAGVAVALFLALAPGVFWNRLQTLWMGGETEVNWQTQSAKFSEEQRERLFWRSIEFTLEDPLLGVGVGNFSIKSGNVTRKATEWLGTHNTYTQISSEAGIPALLLYISLIIGTARSMLRISGETSKRPEFEDFCLFSRAILVGILVFAFAGFFAHLAYDYYFYYVVGMAACLNGAYQRATQVGETKARPGRPSLQPRMAG